jgi:hypothetical protein
MRTTVEQNECAHRPALWQLDNCTRLEAFTATKGRAAFSENDFNIE